MLRTTCKKALDNIRAYILENTDISGYDKYEEPETFEEAALIIWDEFQSAKKYELCRPRTNIQECFIDWCAGLPSILDTCYYYNRSAVDDLGEILEETAEEKARFTESQAEQQLSWLIYREISKAALKAQRTQDTTDIDRAERKNAVTA